MRRASTVALAALLIACQPSTGPPPQATPPVSTYRPEAAGHKGGTLVLADWEVPDTLNPLTAPTENDLRVAALLFAPLWNLDPKLTSYPDLVARVPSRENGGVKAGADGTTMTIDLHLKPGLEWSDGQPLTVDDVIFTWQSICAGDLPVATAGWDHIVGMDRRSDTEVVWRFGPRAAGACGLPAATASGLYPPYLLLGPRARLLPRHRLSALPLSAWASDPYFHGPDVVSGPFAYKSAVKDQLLTLVANPRYASGRDHGAYLDQVVYRTYGGKPELLAGLTSGEADVGFHLGSDDIPVLQKLTDSTTIIAPSLQTEFLNPNHATNVQTGRAPPWVGDPRVLDALSLGADRQALDKTVFGGVAEAPPELRLRGGASDAGGRRLESGRRRHPQQGRTAPRVRAAGHLWKCGASEGAGAAPGTLAGARGFGPARLPQSEPVPGALPGARRQCDRRVRYEPVFEHLGRRSGRLGALRAERPGAQRGDTRRPELEPLCGGPTGRRLSGRSGHARLRKAPGGIP
ncbi:MAG: hypothetical protein DMG70_00450, partial [Acidobacteria bacterium]